MPTPGADGLTRLAAAVERLTAAGQATALDLQAARSTIAVQAEQLKELHGRVNRQERRTYRVVPVDAPPDAKPRPASDVR
jgi:hypothetical protein